MNFMNSKIELNTGDYIIANCKKLQHTNNLLWFKFGIRYSKFNCPKSMAHTHTYLFTVGTV